MEADILFKILIPILLAFLMLLTPILINANDLKDRELNPYLKERYQHRGIDPYCSDDSLLVIIVSAKMAADRDAGMDPEGIFWFGGGCLLGILETSSVLFMNNTVMSRIFLGTGLITAGIAYSVEPKVEVSKLIGKSPKYIDAYTKEYDRMVRKSHAQEVFIGYILPLAIPTFISIVYIIYCLTTFNFNCGAY